MFLGHLVAQWDTTLCATPMGSSSDAEMRVSQALSKLPEPKRMKFLAELNPANSNGGYVVYFLQVQGSGAGNTRDEESG